MLSALHAMSYRDECICGGAQLLRYTGQHIHDHNLLTSEVKRSFKLSVDQ
jgi:hypothetical protein